MIFINCFVLLASRLSTLVLSIARCNSRGAYLERLLFDRPGWDLLGRGRFDEVAIASANF